MEQTRYGLIGSKLGHSYSKIIHEQIADYTYELMPLPHVPFEYYFYVQLVCPAGCDAAACNSLLETLTGACSTLRLLGAFTLDGIDQQ